MISSKLHQTGIATMLFLLISLIGKAQTSDSLLVSQMKTVGINFYPHNEVQLIMSGKDKFDLLFEDIRQAKSSVHLEYFNFRSSTYCVRSASRVLRYVRCSTGLVTTRTTNH